MNFLKRIFRKGDPPSDPPVLTGATLPDATAAPPLAFNHGLSEFDQALVKLLSERVVSRLEEMRAKHLDVFHQLLGQPIGGLSALEFVAAQLQSLVEALSLWKEHLVTEVHQMVMRARPDLEGDVLKLFFDTSVNATNYDALVFEEVIRVATATFDDALTASRLAYPSLKQDEVKKLDWQWTRQLVLWGSAWKEMHQDRFNQAFRSWQTHQHTDSLVTTFGELCRAHFQMAARLATRNYRKTLLPVVTVTFAGDPEALSQAAAVLSETEFGAVRDAAFEGFPLTDAWQRSPAMARAYVFAWYDVFRIASDTKEEAIAEGRERYAAEIHAVDCDEQFVRLGEQKIDEGFAPLFEEVRSFYSERLSR